MSILAQKEIRCALEAGFIAIENSKEEVGATSVDISVGELFKQQEIVGYKKYGPPILGDLVPIPLIDNDYWLLGPNKFYLFNTNEHFYLAPGFSGKIFSRSSWARYGIACNDQDDKFNSIYGEFYGEVICSIRTLGTIVKLRPNDKVCQVIFSLGGFNTLLDRDLANLLKEGEPIIIRDGQAIRDLEIIVKSDVKMTAGFSLTYNNVILLYDGGLIDPKDTQKHFSRKVVDPKGIFLKKDTFFLSSSAEEIHIPTDFVGMLKETNGLYPCGGNVGLDSLSKAEPSTMYIHSSAPKIDPSPRFKGKVTFENYTLDNIIFVPGSRATELVLCPLFRQWDPNERDVSRYNNQREVMPSKPEKYTQLCFDF